MKTLLNITIFTSALLSIFSTSLTLYELPLLKESISILENDQVVERSSLDKDMKRIYISHDSSNERKEEISPLLTVNNAKQYKVFNENYINVFGVKIPNNNEHRKI